MSVEGRVWCEDTYNSALTAGISEQAPTSDPLTADPHPSDTPWSTIRVVLGTEAGLPVLHAANTLLCA